jgi:heme exporter protein C
MAVLSYLANPDRFMAVSKWFALPFTLLGVGLILIGAYFGLFVVPEDFQQGDSARIMFVHVPAMWLSLFAYAFMTGASIVSFIWRHTLADVAAKSAAPIGAAVTALGLMTGSIWGYPTWGTWWEWGDARLVSVLVLFFIYLGYMAIWQAMDTPQKAARAAAILCLVGAVNLPIIQFSVEWFSTLHQVKMKAADEFKYPMYVVALGYFSLFGGLTLFNMRAEVMNTRAEMLMQRRQAAE